MFFSLILKTQFLTLETVTHLRLGNIPHPSKQKHRLNYYQPHTVYNAAQW